MLHDQMGPDPQAPRSAGFWIILGGVVVAQLIAFWVLCSQQVRKAEARSAETQMAQMALADCLQYVPGSTIASCTSRLAPAGPSQTAAAGQVTPVGFVGYR